MIEYSKSDTDLFTGEKPPQRVRQRRADPKSRKLEKEQVPLPHIAHSIARPLTPTTPSCATPNYPLQAEFPEGLDLPPPRNAIFSGVSEDQMKRIHSMLGELQRRASTVANYCSAPLLGTNPNPLLT